MQKAGSPNHFENLVGSLGEAERRSYLKSQQREDLLPSRDHFNAIVEGLDPATRKLYDATKHARIETAFRNRQFIVYDVQPDNEPFEIDRITVGDFGVEDSRGVYTQVYSSDQRRIMVVGYRPVQLFDYDVVVCIPLHLTLRINWSTTPGNVDGGSLGFPLLIRTLSRKHLRERGVTYCETGRSFNEEFNRTAGN